MRANSLAVTVTRRATSSVSRRSSLRRALSLLAEPVPGERRRRLDERWRELDPRWRLPLQGYGRQAPGCGATLGLNPRCDFDCLGCYLGGEANRAARFSSGEIDRQLVALRRHLGPKGNLQITDGEVTLLPERELVAVIRRACELDLIPMLMTHGDTFRRRPGLLARLVAEGGLREVSFHIDTTQRGRRGRPVAPREEDLHPLRDEMAEHVRRVRRATGVRLRAATTVTVGRRNLDGVAGVVERCFALRDVFGLVAFLPMADVGRTREGLGGVSAEALWRRIEPVLERLGAAPSSAAERMHFGHPDCSRLEPLLVYERAGEPPRLLRPVRPGCAEDLRLARRWLDGPLAGLNFRDDPSLERICRGLGAVGRAPGLVLGPLRRWLRRRAAEVGTSLPRLACELATGRARVGSFTVTSHHFMSRRELDTPTGRERLAACVFRVPVGDELVPMCTVNATGLRQRLYELGTATAASQADVEPVLRAAGRCAPGASAPCDPCARSAGEQICIIAENI